MKGIKILGAGIAGLTAAINLKKAGTAVEVHERKGFCGKHINNFQFLENWTFDKDALDILQSMHIQTDLHIFKPRYSQQIMSPSGKKYIGTSKKPITYLVKRGNVKDSIDKSLESQSLQLGIKIFLNSTLKAREADIIATGIKHPSFMATGILFSCTLQDKSLLLLDNNLSENFYSYFVVTENVEEITCVNPIGAKDHKVRSENTVRRFEEILSIKVDKILEKFSAPLNFDPLIQIPVNMRWSQKTGQCVKLWVNPKMKGYDHGQKTKKVQFRI